MKKLTSIFVFILLINQLIQAQYNQSILSRQEAEKQRINYKQKNIRGYVDRQYSLKDGKLSDTIYNYELITIDTSGNIIQRAMFDKFRKIKSLYRYDFNDKNENIKSYFIIKNRLMYQTDNYYDLSNKLIEKIETNEFGSVHSKERFVYNSKANPSKSVVIGPSGTVVSRSEMKFNSENQLFAAKHFLIEGSSSNKKEKLFSELKIEYENNTVKNIQLSLNNPESETKQEIVFNEGLLSEMNQTNNGNKTQIKREHFTFDQKIRNIERWLPIPDYSKYFKNNDAYGQTFKFETGPNFPGGIEALKDYIQVNLKYPKKAKKAGKEGLVIIGFVIDPGGNPGNIRIHKSVDYELDDAAIELVKKMPKWKPALNEKGKETMSSFKLPINFVIE